jgi:hypothetical protein
VFPAAEKEMVRSMLSESLRAVISQTLLKTKDGGGRVAAHEIMIGTPAIRNLIRENKVAQMYSAIQTGQSRHADARPVPDRPGHATGLDDQEARATRRSRTTSPADAARALTDRALAPARQHAAWNANRPSSSCTTCCG